MTTCPTTDRWQALLGSDQHDPAMETHLAGCPHCRSVLDDLAVGSSGWLRDANRLATLTADDPAMVHALDRLRESAIDEPVSLDFLAPSTVPGVRGTLGRYQVLDVLGRGAFGIVLKALDPDLLRPVAIKVLAPHLAPNGTARQRFLREARAAAAVSHDHVVTIHAVEPADGLPYLVMEYVTGVSLQGRLDRDGPLPPGDIARIGRQAADGLAAAHAQGLVHRDIKPANILLENGVERVKITDFGLARAADDARLTQTGVAAGTPLYMSPEQARGESLDARSDLFSLGSVLYALATGFPPFRAGSAMGVLNRISHDPPRPIRETIPDFPPALEKVIMQLLEKSPARRFQSAPEVSQRLTEFVASAPESHKPRQNGTWGVLLAFAAAVLVAGVILTFKTPKGTLVVEVDDPAIKVALDGEELSITGAGPQEVRLKPGTYEVSATKDGQPVSHEVVTITKDGKQVVKVTAKTGPVAAAPPAKPVPDSVLDKLAKDYEALVGKLASAPQGALILTPGPIPDYEKATVGITEPNRKAWINLLRIRDQFAISLPKAQAAAASGRGPGEMAKALGAWMTTMQQLADELAAGSNPNVRSGAFDPKRSPAERAMIALLDTTPALDGEAKALMLSAWRDAAAGEPGDSRVQWLAHPDYSKLKALLVAATEQGIDADKQRRILKEAHDVAGKIHADRAPGTPLPGDWDVGNPAWTSTLHTKVKQFESIGKALNRTPAGLMFNTSPAISDIDKATADFPADRRADARELLRNRDKFVVELSKVRGIVERASAAYGKASPADRFKLDDQVTAAVKSLDPALQAMADHAENLLHPVAEKGTLRAELGAQVAALGKRFDALAKRLSATPHGPTFLLPGTITDYDKATEHLKAYDQAQAMKGLLRARDQFAQLHPRAHDAVATMGGANDAKLAEQARTQIAALEQLVKSMEDHADVLAPAKKKDVVAAKPTPVQKHAELKKLFDAEIARLKTGALKNVLNTATYPIDVSKEMERLGTLSGDPAYYPQRKGLSAYSRYEAIEAKYLDALGAWDKAAPKARLFAEKYAAGVVPTGENDAAQAELRDAERKTEVYEKAMTEIVKDLQAIK